MVLDEGGGGRGGILMDTYGFLDSYRSGSYRFLWIPKTSYGFLWIPIDSYGFPWIHIYSYGCPMVLYGFLPMDSYDVL